MKNPTPSPTKTCMCRQKTDCFSEGLIYKASVSTNTNKYFKRTFTNKSCKKNTVGIGKREREGERERETERETEREEREIIYICEKLLIARAHPNIFLNKLDEFVPKCRHRNKFKLSILR